MHNFKVGDKVKLKPGRTGYAVDRSKQSWVIVDSLPTALELDTKTLSIHSKYVTNYDNDFELVGDVPMFDMHTNSWFIKIANEEEYNAAEAWLAKVYGRNLGMRMPSGLVALTNCSGSTLAKGVYWVRNGDHIRNAKEIKLTFERACSVSDVVWPEDTNAEAKRLLVELQAQSAELQEKAENLQKTMK